MLFFSENRRKPFEQAAAKKAINKHKGNNNIDNDTMNEILMILLATAANVLIKNGVNNSREERALILKLNNGSGISDCDNDDMTVDSNTITIQPQVVYDANLAMQETLFKMCQKAFEELSQVWPDQVEVDKEEMSEDEKLFTKLAAEKNLFEKKIYNDEESKLKDSATLTADIENLLKAITTLKNKIAPQTTQQTIINDYLLAAAKQKLKQNPIVV
ncbi:MAG: hypothetical protein OMM_04746 [Candidatus Magnetoglobus multicellularis str. Araruama]|uniref:Uncharacterized protein n=1 Tax=Candidatus Magnetoglobus multicellularis str. Araruama TaxID=890399 RepID=A0A1V1NZX3_9BACT|nr:MAG: hypothetical protein OMM_04746 [Candidatus Magnetoglobus multicellularis str. Araruama]